MNLVNGSGNGTNTHLVSSVGFFSIETSFLPSPDFGNNTWNA